jgi:hypothetical protein
LSYADSRNHCHLTYVAPQRFPRKLTRMIKGGDSIRFTPAEIERAARLGLELGEVRSTADLTAAEIALIELWAEACPDLLYKLAEKVAEAKGIRLPPRLTPVK